MRLELQYRSDVDLSQPGMQVEIRNHIARCLRDYPHGDQGVITLAGVEHCFMYVIYDGVVDTVIGPPAPKRCRSPRSARHGRRMRSAAKSGSRSYRLSAQRYSIATFLSSNFAGEVPLNLSQSRQRPET
jgi:hypothetical protein